MVGKRDNVLSESWSLASGVNLQLNIRGISRLISYTPTLKCSLRPFWECILGRFLGSFYTSWKGMTGALGRHDSPHLPSTTWMFPSTSSKAPNPPKRPKRKDQLTEIITINAGCLNFCVFAEPPQFLTYFLTAQGEGAISRVFLENHT